MVIGDVLAVAFHVESIHAPISEIDVIRLMCDHVFSLINITRASRAVIHRLWAVGVFARCHFLETLITVKDETEMSLHATFSAICGQRIFTRRPMKNKEQASLTNPRDALHDGERVANE